MTEPPMPSRAGEKDVRLPIPFEDLIVLVRDYAIKSSRELETGQLKEDYLQLAIAANRIVYSFGPRQHLMPKHKRLNESWL